MPYILILLFCIANVSHAEDFLSSPYPESTINISGGYDSDENKDYSIQFDLEFESSEQFSIGYAKSDSPNANTDTYQIYMSSSTIETLSVDANFYHVDYPDALETYAMSSGLNLNLENWHLSATPTLSAISFFSVSDDRKTFDLYSKGLIVSASYFGFDQYYFSARYFKNSFSDKPSFINGRFLSNLNKQAFNQFREAIRKFSDVTSSLEKQDFAISVGHLFNWGSIDLNWSNTKLFNVMKWLEVSDPDISTEDRTINSYSISGNIPTTKKLSIDVSLGWQSYSDATDDLIFSSAGISYSF